MKRNLKNVVFALMFGFSMLGLSGCNSETECCTIIDTNVNLLYKNDSGENLLNSSSDFEASNIRVYYKNGNDFEYLYNRNLDAPNMHRIYEDEEGNLILTIYPSNFYEGIQSTTLIELNKNVVDTLVCEFELESNKEICTRAWLNGSEMINRYIEIEK